MNKTNFGIEQTEKNLSALHTENFIFDIHEVSNGHVVNMAIAGTFTEPQSTEYVVKKSVPSPVSIDKNNQSELINDVANFIIEQLKHGTIRELLYDMCADTDEDCHVVVSIQKFKGSSPFKGVKIEPNNED